MNKSINKKPTSEQLVETLGNDLEITVCSDVVYGLDYEYKQLQKKYMKLKEKFVATSKGLRKVIAKRRKWKNRYYKIKKQLKQRDEVIDEILSSAIFENDCPASISGEELDCCENCQDDYKKCWLKYFKEKIQRR